MTKTRKSIIYGEFAAIKSFKPLEFDGIKIRVEQLPDAGTHHSARTETNQGITFSRTRSWLKKEGSESVTNCYQLKIEAAGSKTNEREWTYFGRR